MTATAQGPEDMGDSSLNRFLSKAEFPLKKKNGVAQAHGPGQQVKSFPMQGGDPPTPGALGARRASPWSPSPALAFPQAERKMPGRWPRGLRLVRRTRR